MESLESRQLLAADLLAADVDEDHSNCQDPNCPCNAPSCTDQSQEDQLNGHYYGDGHDHSADLLAALGPSLESFYLSDPAHQQSAAYRVNDLGRGYYLDTFEYANSESADEEEGNGAGEQDDGPKVPLSELPQLSSNPSAPNTFYLDFNGERVVDTDWNRNDNAGLPIHARPYDTDGDVTTFSQAELAAIEEIWQRVSEDYAPFDINITTIEPPESDLRARRTAQRAIISTSVDDKDMGGTGEVWFPDAGGVAFIGSWLENDDVPVWVFQDKLPDTPKGVAEAVSHEFGHAVGLSHHGDDGSAYYNGHGSGETSWAPIMGAGYRSNLTQWSDGKYESANNPQNDLRVITTSFNRIDYRTDDHLEGNDSATPLTIEDGWVSGQGIIEQNNDYDSFKLEHPGGPVNLQIKPSDIGGNLDVLAILYDEQENEILEFSPSESTSANVVFEDLEAGNYYLDVEGGGFLPDAGPGYSDYGSLGSYTIEGSLGVTIVVADSGGLYDINEGTDLTLVGSASIGTNELSTFKWDVDGDGIYDDAEGEIVVLTWEQLGQLDNPIIDDGEYTIGLEVQGINDLIDTAESTLRIANVGPKIEPIEPVQAVAGEPVTFDIIVTDIEADPLNFINWETGDGEIKTTSVPTLTYTYDEPGEYSVIVSVGDDYPKVNTETFQVTVTMALEPDPDFPGDADRDNEVTFSDFLIVSRNFGNDQLAWEDGDFNGDGSVGFDDFLLLSDNFGKTAPG